MGTYNSTVSYTKAHIDQVRAKMEFFASVLALRGLKHDSSKLTKPESFGWAAMDKEPMYPYGSIKYYEKMSRYKEVLKHHYTINSHHPEHFSDPNNQMDLIDLIEMLCDWFSYKSDITWAEGYERITQQCERFAFNDTIKNLILNTFRNFLAKQLFDESSLIDGAEKAVADAILYKVAKEKGWDTSYAMSDSEILDLDIKLDALLSAKTIDIESLKELQKDLK